MSIKAQMIEKAKSEGKELYLATTEFNGQPRNACKLVNGKWISVHNFGQSTDMFVNESENTANGFDAYWRGTILVKYFYFLR